MTMIEVFIAQLQNAHDHIAHTLQDLSDEQINYRPSAESHSIGFAIWHALRAWDDYYALITHAESIYARENWAERFGFDTTGKGVNGIGTGFTTQDVVAIRLRVAVLCDFLERLLAHTRASLSAMNDDVLLHEAIVPWWNPSTVTFARVLSHVVAHTYSHIGEAEYIRGLLNK